jgi:hypothetical protein
MSKQRGRVTADLPLDDFIWMKDHPEKTKADHIRDAVAQYIRLYEQGAVTEEDLRIAEAESYRAGRADAAGPIGPNTVITVDGEQVGRVVAGPPTIDFGPAPKPEIDPSTGKPIA